MNKLKKDEKIVDVNIDEVYPAEYQVRIYFNEEAINELAESINTSGLIQPITVRPKPAEQGKYEIVCGERRWKASKLAGKETIACIIRQMDDEEAEAIQLVENLQREDLQPMEEAIYFRHLIEDRKMNITDIALKCDKTVRYIKNRYSLNQLIPKAQEYLSSGVLNLSMSLKIATCTEDLQKKILGSLVSTLSVGGKRISYCGSMKDLQGIIASHTRILSMAPFDINDASLVSDAKGCGDCFKKTTSSQLFGDVTNEDRCLDDACFVKKAKQHRENLLQQAKKYNPEIQVLEVKESWDAVSPSPNAYDPYQKPRYIPTDEFSKQCGKCGKFILYSNKKPAELINYCPENESCAYKQHKEMEMEQNEQDEFVDMDKLDKSLKEYLMKYTKDNSCKLHSRFFIESEEYKKIPFELSGVMLHAAFRYVFRDLRDDYNVASLIEEKIGREYFMYEVKGSLLTIFSYGIPFEKRDEAIEYIFSTLSEQQSRESLKIYYICKMIRSDSENIPKELFSLIPDWPERLETFLDMATDNERIRAEKIINQVVDKENDNLYRKDQTKNLDWGIIKLINLAIVSDDDDDFDEEDEDEFDSSLSDEGKSGFFGNNKMEDEEE